MSAIWLTEQAKIKMMFWKSFVEKLAPDAEFQPPYSGRFQEAERKLGAPLPGELKNLLRESDGVRGEWGLGLIWKLELIVEVNVEMRTHPDYKRWHMPFEPLLFFADAGNGDQFAFTMVADMERDSRIFAWNHEDDSRVRVAPSLEMYLEWWLQGKIKL